MYFLFVVRGQNLHVSTVVSSAIGHQTPKLLPPNGHDSGCPFAPRLPEPQLCTISITLPMAKTTCESYMTHVNPLKPRLDEYMNTKERPHLLRERETHVFSKHGIPDDGS